MTYAAELDDRRQEVRRGYASNSIRFWPKVIGSGNVAVSGTPTYANYLPSGGAALSSGNATVTAVGSISRLTVTINASATDTYVLDEGYRIDFTWSDGTITYLSAVRYDVVREPVNDALGVSFHDLVEEIADAEQRLLRQARILDSTRTTEQHASVLAMRAWEDVRQWIRAQAEGAYARLIVDREALRPVVVAQAIARMYRAEGGGRDSEERQLGADWEAVARGRFSGLGRLAYDLDDSGEADSHVGAFSVTRARRRWR